MTELLEHRSLETIVAYFESRGLALTVHTSPPERPSAQELSRLPRAVRRAIEKDSSSHWADLGELASHYGSGTTEEEAIRSAARRYRIEQAPGGNEPS